MRVLASLPQTGPLADVLRGAELAAEQTGIELVVPKRSATSGIRRALKNSDVVAYLGELRSGDVMRSSLMLGEAGILQVAPIATFIELGGPTLIRLAPHDGIGALAIAEWLARRKVKRLLIVHDHGDHYGEPVASMCELAATARRIAVRRRRVWNHDEPLAPDFGHGEQAVLHVGVPGRQAPGLWAEMHRHAPQAWMLGHEGFAEAGFAAALEPDVAARVRIFTALRAPLAFYGYEAMQLIADAIRIGQDDREIVVRAARATRNRQSVLGTYSIDPDGHTTSTAYGRYAIADGVLVWDRTSD